MVSIVVLVAFLAWLWPVGIPLIYSDVPGVTPGERLKAITDTRTAVVAGLAATASFGALWISIRSQRLGTEVAMMSQRQFHLAQQVASSERKREAFDQLGSDEIASRLAGIYALEQIARQPFTRGDDARVIVEALSAFVEVQQSRPRRFRRRTRPGTTACLPLDVRSAMSVLDRLRGELAE